jgi:sulfur-oxidizing protein SoxY
MKRRLFLKGSMAGSFIAIAAGSGLLTPGKVLAAWPKDAFLSKSVSDSMAKIGASAASTSAEVMLDVPNVAENGAAVPVKVETSLKGVNSISILIEKNQQPLAANVLFSGNATPYISTRIKMAQTSNVIAVVEAGGKSYTASKEVKVTVGGCG